MEQPPLSPVATLAMLHGIISLSCPSRTSRRTPVFQALPVTRNPVQSKVQSHITVNMSFLLPRVRTGFLPRVLKWGEKVVFQALGLCPSAVLEAGRRDSERKKGGVVLETGYPRWCILLCPALGSTVGVPA